MLKKSTKRKLTPQNFYKVRYEELKEKVREVEAVRTAFQIGSNGSADYRDGFMDGLETALSIYENREPNLLIAIKK